MKQAGGKHDEAVKLFDSALGLDPYTTDALIHCANCFLLKQRLMKPGLILHSAYISVQTIY